MSCPGYYFYHLINVSLDQTFHMCELHEGGDAVFEHPLMMENKVKIFAKDQLTKLT